MKNGGIWDHFHPRLKKWFTTTIGSPTPVQTSTWSALKNRENVLLVSPTGSGKTLAAVIPAIDPILKGEVDRSKTNIVYISPMKALGADILKTLTSLSAGIGRIGGRKVRRWGRGRKKKGEILPDAELQVGIRTGDVPQSERRRMLLDPPDLLVITPENLLLMLCSKAKETVDSVGWIIVDEVHEMVPSKRGALLSLTLEMLTEMVHERTGKEPLRIGLSATVKPVSTAAKYLVGMDGRGRSRQVTRIVEDSGKDMVIEFRTLMDDEEKDSEIREKVLSEIGSMIEKDKGPLVVFHNTRKAAEEMAYSLVQRGYDKVMPHHGSLGADVRRTAEEGLRTGELKAIISSTSLELGIDIGEVETVCQIGSPKDPSKMLQRFGRSGHGLGRTSHGIIYPLDGIDLMEALAVSLAVARGKLQRLDIPDESLDVLAQFMIGFSLNDAGLKSDHIWKLIRKAYPYRSIKRSSINDILDLLSERLPGPNQPPPRLWFDDKKNSFMPRRNTGQAFYLNCGTIPKETSYRVIDERTRRAIGDLSRDFGETLYERDVILLGSKVYRISGFSGTKILVREDPDSQPTVPKWSGEIMPRPGTVAAELVRLYEGGFTDRWKKDSDIKVKLDPNGGSICRSVISGLSELDLLPSVARIPVEFKRMRGTRSLYIFMIPEGRQVTEIIGRTMAYGIRKAIGAKVDYVSTDDGFAVISPKEMSVDELKATLKSEEFEKVVKGLVLTSSIFRSRFTHCMNKSLLVLSRFRGKDTGALYRRNRVENLLSLVMNAWYSEGGWEDTKGPLRGLILLAEEALKEVFIERIDMKRCREIVSGIDSGSVPFKIVKMREGPSLLGSSILRSWKSRMDELEDKDISNSDTASSKIRASGAERTILPIQTEGTSIEHDKLIIDSLLHAAGAGERTRDSSKGPIEPDREDHGQFISFGGDELDFLVSPIPPSIGFKATSIANLRANALTSQGDLGHVIRRMPFFTHPIEVVSRSADISFNDIRSLMKSGRIKPVHLIGDDRSADRRWASIYRDLADPDGWDRKSGLRSLKEGLSYSRSDIAKILDQSGEDLTSSINDATEKNIIGRLPASARDMVGLSQSDFIPICCDDDTEEMGARGISGLERFFRFFGPFEASELVKLFGKQVLITAAKAISTGVVQYGIGPEGPISIPSTVNIDTDRIWLWSRRGSRSMRSIIEVKRSGNSEITLRTLTDPATQLTGKWDIWVDKEPVRGSIMTILLAFREGSLLGRINIVETADLIRISDIEVDDFDMVVEVSSALARWTENYERLGFGTFLIEKIMGIPAGEAARDAVKVFLDDGFKVELTPKGAVLLKGAEVLRGLSREDVLYNMFTAQGLIEECHWRHPIEVISKLGSVVDRWELLSRMGSSRYRRLSINDPNLLRDKNEKEWESITSPTLLPTGNSQVDWSEATSTSGIGLTDMKDLAKRFSLVKGMMDQPYPVWSLDQEFKRYPPPPKGEMNSIDPRLRSLLDDLKKMDPSDVGPFLKSRDLNKEMDELLRKGLTMEDPWGDLRLDLLKRSKTEKQDKERGKSPRGLFQTKWLLRNARRLSIFTFEDLMNYSPSLDDPGKVRSLINDLVGTKLERCISVGTGFQVHYRVIGDGSSELKRCPEPDELRELTVISPKDRMSRVVMHDIKGAIARGHGFSIFKGGRPVALISIKKLKKALKNTEFGETAQGSSSLEYWSVKKAWVDLRFKRKDLLKSIRRSFYSLGCQLITDDEKLKLESLYRDAESITRTSK
ncbi:MAG: DEAD/DEAH box helicase [Thermoplasmatota archaeon]